MASLAEWDRHNTSRHANMCMHGHSCQSWRKQLCFNWICKDSPTENKCRCYKHRYMNMVSNYLMRICRIAYYCNSMIFNYSASAGSLTVRLFCCVHLINDYYQICKRAVANKKEAHPAVIPSPLSVWFNSCKWAVHYPVSVFLRRCYFRFCIKLYQAKYSQETWSYHLHNQRCSLRCKETLNPESHPKSKVLQSKVYLAQC